MGEQRNERKNKIETKTGMNYMNNKWECPFGARCGIHVYELTHLIYME